MGEAYQVGLAKFLTQLHTDAWNRNYVLTDCNKADYGKILMQVAISMHGTKILKVHRPWWKLPANSLRNRVRDDLDLFIEGVSR